MTSLIYGRCSLVSGHLYRVYETENNIGLLSNQEPAVRENLLLIGGSWRTSTELKFDWCFSAQNPLIC